MMNDFTNLTHFLQSLCHAAFSYFRVILRLMANKKTDKLSLKFEFYPKMLTFEV